LYRETPYLVKQLKHLDPDVDYVLNVHAMAVELKQSLFHDSNFTLQQVVENYCFLCFLCGNDFLPRFPSVNLRNGGLAHVLNVYHALKEKELVHGLAICWPNLQHLFLELGMSEQQMIQENIHWKAKQAKRFRPSKDNHEDAWNLVTTTETREHHLLNHFDRYYPFLFQQSDPSAICRNYLAMLEWTWSYYHGVCKHYYVKYHYHLAPLFRSLAEFTPCLKGEELVPFNPRGPPNPVALLLYVLPPSDFNDFIPLEPPQLQSIMLNHPNLRTTNHMIRHDFCKFFHEAHVDFSYVNFDRLNDDCSKLLHTRDSSSMHRALRV
jgi:5'-3' exonuclease